jgi:hypothetical protein
MVVQNSPGALHKGLTAHRPIASEIREDRLSRQTRNVLDYGAVRCIAREELPYGIRVIKHWFDATYFGDVLHSTSRLMLDVLFTYVHFLGQDHSQLEMNTSYSRIRYYVLRPQVRPMFLNAIFGSAKTRIFFQKVPARARQPSVNYAEVLHERMNIAQMSLERQRIIGA